MNKIEIFKNKILIVVLIFLFAFLLRIWNLNAMGRTWDEAASTDIGFRFIQLISTGDFSNSFWAQQTDHPPLTRYIYGIVSYFDIEKFVSNNNIPTFKYDITASRLISVIFSSLSVAVVVVATIEFISLSVGIIAGIILTMLPFFLGLSQLATLESILFFFFTLTVYCYLKFLERPSFKKILVTGVSLGLAVLSKYTNVLVVPIMIAIYFFFNKYSNSKYSTKKLLKNNIHIALIGLVTFFIFWPMPWFNLANVINYNYKFRIINNSMPDIEIFFGRLMHLPVFYYFVMFLITTPILVLILFFLGAKLISDKDKNKNIIFGQKWFLYSLIAWFCIPFIQSFYNFRHHGVRFIIEIYAPLSIISAIGLDYLLKKFIKNFFAQIIIFILFFVYLLTILINISPYYLDYYNEVVGGTKNVYQKRLFEIGWWGQGMKEVGNYLITHAKKNSKIAVYISPPAVFPKLNNFNVTLFDPLTGKYNADEKFDYVVVNYFHVLREGFDDSGIKKDYKLVYEVKADGGVLVYVYKR